MKRALFLVLTFSATVAVAAPKKDDVIVGLGVAISGPIQGDLDRQSTVTGSVEWMASKKVGLRSDYFRISQPTSDCVLPFPWSCRCRTVVGQEPADALSATISRHVKDWSFPVGLIGVNVDGRSSPSLGGVAGAWYEKWKCKHWAVGAGANYLILRNTVIDQDFLDARIQLRGLF